MMGRGLVLRGLALAALAACVAGDAQCHDDGSIAASEFGLGASDPSSSEPAAGAAAEGCGCAASTGRSDEDRNSRAPSPDVDVSPLMAEVLAAVSAGSLDRNAVAATPLLHVPAGVFIMGTDDPRIMPDGEHPAREVEVSAFQLQEMEVSNRQFAEFVLETGFVSEAEAFGWSFCFKATLSQAVLDTVVAEVDAVPWWVPVHGSNWWHPSGPDGDVASEGLLDHPVVHVSHSDARAYCSWLGLRLPREAEFERATRGDLARPGKDLRSLFAWGNELVPGGTFRANLWQGTFPTENTAEDGHRWAAPVDSFGAQNELGFKNIVGNVWEWVADAWTTKHRLADQDGNRLKDFQVEYFEKEDDPTVERVKRGGSYMCHESYCYRYRVVSRSHNTADSSAQNLGFRCAKDEVDEPLSSS